MDVLCIGKSAEENYRQKYDKETENMQSVTEESHTNMTRNESVKLPHNDE